MNTEKNTASLAFLPKLHSCRPDHDETLKPQMRDILFKHKAKYWPVLKCQCYKHKVEELLKENRGKQLKALQGPAVGLFLRAEFLWSLFTGKPTGTRPGDEIIVLC